MGVALVVMVRKRFNNQKKRPERRGRGNEVRIQETEIREARKNILKMT
jgi:hypothetical protein